MASEVVYFYCHLCVWKRVCYDHSNKFTTIDIFGSIVGNESNRKSTQEKMRPKIEQVKFRNAGGQDFH